MASLALPSISRADPYRLYLTEISPFHLSMSGDFPTAQVCLHTIQSPSAVWFSSGTPCAVLPGLPYSIRKVRRVMPAQEAPHPFSIRPRSCTFKSSSPSAIATDRHHQPEKWEISNVSETGDGAHLSQTHADFPKLMGHKPPLMGDFAS